LAIKFNIDDLHHVLLIILAQFFEVFINNSSQLIHDIFEHAEVFDALVGDATPLQAIDD
jgi:hypothetical protein